MAHKIALIIVLLFFTSSSVVALNITRILDRYPEYSSMNSLFTSTGLNKDILKRQTITVLALDEGACGSLSSKPLQVVKRILSNHVILDYFDMMKLRNIGQVGHRTVQATTLYQTTGAAEYKQGFVNITVLHSGDIAFGSGVRGSPLNARLLGTVFTNPFNISLLHVSEAIIAPGFEDDDLPALPPTPDANTTKTNTSAPAPAPMESDDEPPSDSPPSPDDDDDDADSPDGDVPADSPDADDQSPSPSKSSSSSSMLTAGWGFGVALMIGLALNLMGKF
ncbi:hypothetical protein ACFE04_001867 [Oxalis oulophora]